MTSLMTSNYVNNVFVDLIEMGFSKDDLAVIVACFTEKEWTGTRIAKELPNKKWSSVQRMLKRRRLHANISSECQCQTQSKGSVSALLIGYRKETSLFFTDEKDFTLEVPTNRQNDRVYAKGRKSDICPNRL